MMKVAAISLRYSLRKTPFQIPQILVEQGEELHPKLLIQPQFPLHSLRVLYLCH